MNQKPMKQRYAVALAKAKPLQSLMPENLDNFALMPTRVIG
jgi:hypothetical protein